MQSNPYQTPAAKVADQAEQYGEVKIWSASGRMGRVRYIGYGVGMTLLMYLVIGLFAGLAGATDMQFLLMVGMVVGGLGMLVVMILLTIQRCHDFNMSGWMSLLLIVPLVPLLFWIIPGTQGANRFGSPPPPNTTGAVVLALVFPALFVVGILAAIAIPAYVDYQQRAQMQMMESQPTQPTQ
jgi:uncharacterized membrane protein YhaH (DUF805 family)